MKIKEVAQGNVRLKRGRENGAPTYEENVFLKNSEARFIQIFKEFETFE